MPDSASYWPVAFYPDGRVRRWTWSCDVCGDMGLAATEAACVTDMNAHMAETHPDGDYAPPPIPA